MELKLDLAQEGLPMAFKDYEIIMLRHLWETDDTLPVPDRPEANSRKLTEVVDEKLPSPHPNRPPPDRRSKVINAANRFVELGIWGYHEVTGRGGYRKVYHAKMAEYTLWKTIKNLVLEKIPK